MATATLVSPAELESYRQAPVDAGTAETAIKVAEGWLRAATHFSVDWPEPVPGQLWAWAVELAALVVDNPGGLLSQTVGGQTTAWAVARRQEILAAAAAEYPKAQPSGSFPPAVPWPLG